MKKKASYDKLVLSILLVGQLTYLLGEEKIQKEQNVGNGIVQNQPETKVLPDEKEKNIGDRLVSEGIDYLEAKGEKRNVAKALECFHKAAEMNTPAAFYNLGLVYLDGTASTEPDYAKAEEYLKRSIEEGMDEGYFVLGELYSPYPNEKYILTTPERARYQNLERALEQFKIALEKGVEPLWCKRNIGFLLLMASDPECQEYLEQAADGGDAMAMIIYAKALHNGDVVSLDTGMALDYAEKLSKEHHDPSLFADFCYEDGMEHLFRGRKREGLMLLKLAADNGNADAMYQLTMDSTDTDEIYTYAIKAYEAGYPRMKTLAAGGYIRQKRYDDAEKLLLEASEEWDSRRQDVSAMNILGIMYMDEASGKQNMEMAEKWLLRAGDNYHFDSYRRLALLHMEAYQNDMKKDFVKGLHPEAFKGCYYYVLWTLGTEQEELWDEYLKDLEGDIPKLTGISLTDHEHEFLKGALLYMCRGSKENIEQGIALLETAAEHGNRHAMWLLITYYTQEMDKRESRGEACNELERRIGQLTLNAIKAGHEGIARNFAEFSGIQKIVGKESKAILARLAAQGNGDAAF